MQRYKHHNQFFSSSPDQYHRTTRTKRAYPQSTPHPHRLQPFSSPRSRRHTASLVARGCGRGDSPFVRRGCVHLLHLELKRKAPHGRSIEHGYERLREPSVVMMGQEQSPKLHSALPRLEYYSMELEWYSTKFSGPRYSSPGIYMRARASMVSCYSYFFLTGPIAQNLTKLCSALPRSSTHAQSAQLLFKRLHPHELARDPYGFGIPHSGSRLLRREGHGLFPPPRAVGAACPLCLLALGLLQYHRRDMPSLPSGQSPLGPGLGMMEVQCALWESGFVLIRWSRRHASSVDEENGS